MVSIASIGALRKWMGDRYRENGFGQLLLSIGFLQVLSFVQRIILTKYALDVVSVGQYAVLLTAFNLFFSVAFLNVYNAFPRFVAQRNYFEVGEIVGSAMAVGIMSWIGCLLVYYLAVEGFGWHFLQDQNQRYLSFLLPASLGMLFLNVVIHLCLAKQKIRLRAVIEVWFRVILFFAIVISGVIWALPGVLTAFGLVHLIVAPYWWWSILRRYRVTIAWNLTGDFWRFGWMETLVVIAFCLGESLDILILDFRGNNQQFIGHYSTAKLLLAVFQLCAISLIHSFSADMAKAKSTELSYAVLRRMATILVPVFACLGFSLWFVAPAIFEFLGDYRPSIAIAEVLIPGAMFKNATLVLAMFLLNCGLQRLRLLAVMIELICLIGSMAYFLLLYPQMGVAIGYSIGSAIAFLTTLAIVILSQRKRRKP